MNKVFFTVAIALASLGAMAQKQVTVKAGTIIPLAAIEQVKAADVQEGQMVDFRVMRDIMVDGVCAVSQGTIAKGKVVEARKSTVAGTKGRLVINIANLTLPNGDPLYFTNTDVRVYGKNRTPVSVVVGIFTLFGFLIPGSKAVMPAGYEVQATVAANTTVSAK
jgi:hypothetical protein